VSNVTHPAFGQLPYIREGKKLYKLIIDFMSHFYRKPEYIKSISRKLRKWQTEAEILLWHKLRYQKVNSLRFLRQKPIFAYKQDNWFDRFYIADFYCHAQRLIIEVDWWIHSEMDRIEYDKLRDEILKNNEYRILRFTNDEVINYIENVINVIIASAQK
jgi:very-short-patch-repair endonuclease